MSNIKHPIVSDEYMGAMLGVAGRYFARTIGGKGYREGTFTRQHFISERRRSNFDKDAEIQFTARFDDECRNGHNTFAITAEITAPGRGRNRVWAAGGCLHNEIEKAFPEVASLIRWHLTSSDGPMHYIANTVYLAGDRDYNGLRKGETRPVFTRDGKPIWELVAVNSLGVALSSTPTGLEYVGAETVPLFILEKNWSGENPPVVPKLEWRQRLKVGEGKARELEAARRIAVWPEATDAELSVEPDELKAALLGRAEKLKADFRAAIESAGFVWAPEASDY